jgi:hypothetical protein
MSKFKKTIILITSTIVATLAGIILCISPITKYLIEKYDVKYTGREITIDWAYTNPLTGYIHLSNVKIFELDSDTLFFSASGISADFSLLKLFLNTYEISDLAIDTPHGFVIQNKSDFNFDDLVEKFSGDSNAVREPVHFNIVNIEVKNGEFYYVDQVTPVYYFIKNVNIQSTGIFWDIDTIAATFSFSSGTSAGDVKGAFDIDISNLNYHFEVLADKYDLDFIGQYLKDLTNYGIFSANLDATVKIAGNFHDRQNIIASGFFGFNDFHFGKTPDNDYGSFEKLAISIIELNPREHIFFYDSIVFQSPYFKFERYDYLDNIQTMFGVDGANIDATIANDEKFNLVIEIANYIKLISRNFLQSHYKINRFAVYDGDFIFEDYSLSEKFSIALNPLTIIADSIDTNNKRINASVKSEIKPFGNLYGTLSINPKDSGDFDLNYNLQKLPLAMFNAYTITYTSFPLNRGTMEVNGAWNVKNGIIQSNNHLLITNLRTSKRLKNKHSSYVPLPLVMAFVRDADNMIDYEIPITGNLKSPKFNLSDVFSDLMKNIFIKPPTTPYRMKVRNVVSEIENSFVLSWKTRQDALMPNQQKFINNLTRFLKKNPEEIIVVHPQLYETREKEYILFFETKKKFFLYANKKDEQSFNLQDSLKIDKMSIKDPLFVSYLNMQINDSMLFTIHEKCSRLIGTTLINSKYEQLNKQRENDFLSYFKEYQVEKQIKISEIEPHLPYNGFSIFKMEYKGKIPDSLIKAYRKMNEITDKEPQKSTYRASSF